MNKKFSIWYWIDKLPPKILDEEDYEEDCEEIETRTYTPLEEPPQSPREVTYTDLFKIPKKDIVEETTTINNATNYKKYKPEYFGKHEVIEQVIKNSKGSTHNEEKSLW